MPKLLEDCMLCGEQHKGSCVELIAKPVKAIPKKRAPLQKPEPPKSLVIPTRIDPMAEAAKNLLPILHPQAVVDNAAIFPPASVKAAAWRLKRTKHAES